MNTCVLTAQVLPYHPPKHNPANYHTRKLHTLCPYTGNRPDVRNTPRCVDIMLSFPSQIMVFAVVALLGINVQNVILANVFIKWAWYARMIRTGVMQHRDRNFVQFSRCVGTPERFILFRHLVPSIAADLAVLASLDVGWAIINISTLSFLGLGVQAPTPEWGAMLNEAKNVLTSNPYT